MQLYVLQININKLLIKIIIHVNTIYRGGKYCDILRVLNLLIGTFLENFTLHPWFCSFLNVYQRRGATKEY